MGKRVSAEVQKEAVSKLLEDVSSIEGVEGEVLTRTNGTQDRNIAHHMPTVSMEGPSARQ